MDGLKVGKWTVSKVNGPFEGDGSSESERFWSILNDLLTKSGRFLRLSERFFALMSKSKSKSKWFRGEVDSLQY